MNNKSDIRVLSSLIIKSINDKSLDKDYGAFLEMCRNKHISSYTLNLMIDCAVSSSQFDSQIKLINTSPHFGWQVKETFLPKPVVKEIVKTKTIETITYKWGWKTWGLFYVFLFLFSLTFSYLNYNFPETLQEMARDFSCTLHDIYQVIKKLFQ